MRKAVFSVMLALSFFGMPPALRPGSGQAWARLPEPARRTDPVETAGLTLDRFLQERSREVAHLHWLQALEVARLKAQALNLALEAVQPGLAFGTGAGAGGSAAQAGFGPSAAEPLPRPGSNQVLRRRSKAALTPSISAGGRSGRILPGRAVKSPQPAAEDPLPAQGSVDWLALRNNPAFTGIQPVAGRDGLLVSYTVPDGHSLEFLRGRSWTYDNAVGAVALLLNGRTADARKILEALAGLQAADGSLGFSYQVDSGFQDARVRAGTLAWAGYAFAFYQTLTGEALFQENAERAAAYLKGLTRGSGLLQGGPDVGWVSTEHNLDAYFFYRELARATGNAAYRDAADALGAAVLEQLWVQESKRSGHFTRGLGDPTPALDANSWGAIFLSAVGEAEKAGQALRYVERTFGNRRRVTGTKRRVSGYAPDANRRTVWLEGTAGVAVARARTGDRKRASKALGELGKVEQAWKSLGLWTGGFPYAVPEYVNPDGDTFSELESAAATGWALIADVVLGGESRFWGR